MIDCFIFTNILRFLIILFSIPLFFMIALTHGSEKIKIFYTFIGITFFIGNVYSNLLLGDTSCTKVFMFNLGILIMILFPSFRIFFTLFKNGQLKDKEKHKIIQ